MRKTKITTTDSDLDMTSWCQEKASSVVERAAIAVDKLRAVSTLSEAERSAVLNPIGTMLWDATKLMAFSAGTEWETTDRDLIVEKGQEGFEELARRYGIETRAGMQEAVLQHSIEELASTIEGALKEERWAGRPKIHEVLGRSRISRETLEPLEELTDRLPMGEVEWPADYAEMQTLLAELRANPEP